MHRALGSVWLEQKPFGGGLGEAARFSGPISNVARRLLASDVPGAIILG